MHNLGAAAVVPLLLLPQGVTIFIALVFMDPEISHAAATPLRLCLCLLLLVPFPCINVAALWKALRLPGSSSSSSQGASSSTSSSSRNVHTDGDEACDCCSTSSKASSTSSRISSASDTSASSVVLPYNPQLYWQRPLLRQTVVVLQRLLPTYYACAHLGGYGPRQRALQSVYFSRLWGYMYIGWTGWMLVAVSGRTVIYTSYKVLHVPSRLWGYMYIGWTGWMLVAVSVILSAVLIM
jgi:hypothetical protein